jgi:SulP family sulfate permease
VHSLTILAAVLVLAPALAYVPMASLAALLLLVAWNMSEAKHFVHILRIAPKSDVSVLLVCFFLTVAFDMVIAVSVGVMLAAVLFMRRMAEVTHAEVAQDLEKLPCKPAEGVLVYDIAGPLFFGAAQKAMAALGIIADKARAVVLRMDQVPAIDATGLVAFESAVEELHQHGCIAIVTGLQAQPRKVFAKSGIRSLPGKLLIVQDIEEALHAAEDHVRATRHTRPSRIMSRIRAAEQ